MRNKVKKLTRRARKAYEENIAKIAKENSKKLWSYINSKSKRRDGIPDLSIDPENAKAEFGRR